MVEPVDEPTPLITMSYCTPVDDKVNVPDPDIALRTGGTSRAPMSDARSVTFPVE
jgi:hypothetical protein